MRSGLRSQRWFDRKDLDGFLHRSWLKSFEDVRDLAARVDDPGLEIDEHSVMVLRNAGPVGAPGMPEWGHLPIPAKLLRRGVTDLLRISDARMSGTSYGSVVLHVERPSRPSADRWPSSATEIRSGWTRPLDGST